MSDDLVFKKINYEDIPFVKNLLKENYLVYEDIEDSHVQLFSAYKNSAFIGVIGLEHFDDFGLLRSMVVLEEYRNKGYGREICTKLLEYAKNEKIKEIYLLTYDAQKFFSKN